MFKEVEIEDSRAEEASSVDIRENWSVDGSEKRTVEERGKGECRGSTRPCEDKVELVPSLVGQ